MTLAARCPSCGTVFRVVQDQLRVSEGWVRCGRCAEVFNAIDTLVEVEADLPPRSPARATAPGADRVMADLARVAGPDRTPTIAPAAKPASPPVAPPRQRESPSGEHGLEEPAFDVAANAPAAVSPGIGTGRPAFVVQAEKAERWRRPVVRAGLAALAVGLSASLVAQVVVEYRDISAARWPALLPALTQACAALGCRVQAPRAIDALVVESSGLVRIENSSLYRLNVVLRNRASHALAAPAIDLTLTDSQGSVIARRVLRWAEFGMAREEVPASAASTLQAALGGLDRPVSGYTIEIFYP